MTDSPNPPDPRVGKVIQDRYKILDIVASGGMGVVYRGERLQLGRPVAIKFLNPWIASQRSFLERFEVEARAMSRLGHPNAIQADPAYRRSPKLAKLLIHSLISDSFWERAAAFLKQDMAEISTPYLEAAAQFDKSPRVRARAAQILASDGHFEAAR